MLSALMVLKDGFESNVDKKHKSPRTTITSQKKETIIHTVFRSLHYKMYK